MAQTSKFRRPLTYLSEDERLAVGLQMVGDCRAHYVEYRQPRRDFRGRYSDLGRIYLLLPIGGLLSLEVRGRAGSPAWIAQRFPLWSHQEVAIVEHLLVRCWEYEDRRRVDGPHEFTVTDARASDKEDWPRVADTAARRSARA